MIIKLPISVALVLLTLTQPGFRLWRTAHVQLTAPTGVEAGELAAELERAWKDVRAWGLALPPTIEARSHPTTSAFVAASGGERSDLGAVTGRLLHLQPIPLLARRPDHLRALRHEMVHVALAAAAARGLPRWFNEGLALLVAGEGHLERKRFATLAALAKELRDGGTIEGRRSAYMAAKRQLARVEKKIGRRGIVGIIGRVEKGESFDRAFRHAVGVTPAAWYRR